MAIDELESFLEKGIFVWMERRFVHFPKTLFCLLAILVEIEMLFQVDEVVILELV